MSKGEEQGFNPEEEKVFEPVIEREEGSEERREKEILDNLVVRRFGRAVDRAKVPEGVREDLMEALKDEARELAQEQVRAEKDELTGLWRKEGLAHQFEIELDYMKTYKPDEVIVLVSIDLDRFKRINDTLGHEGADKILNQLGIVLKKSIRKTDLGGRPGGDEFVLVLTRVKEQDVNGVVESILDNIRKIEMSGIGNLTASLGVNIIGQDRRPYFEEAREQADFAAYVAKRSGRNRVVRADSDEMQETERGEDWFLMMQKEKNGREIERYSKFPELLQKFISLLSQQAKLDYELYLAENEK